MFLNSLRYSYAQVLNRKIVLKLEKEIKDILAKTNRILRGNRLQGCVKLVENKIKSEYLRKWFNVKTLAELVPLCPLM